MPRRGGAAGCNNKKIVIRQYAKPPQLPPHYYEATSRAILDDSLSLLSSSSSSSSSGTSSSTFSSSGNSYSLQAAYTAATQLVRHGMGPRLYGDLVATLDCAAQRILHPENSIGGPHIGGGNRHHDRSERLARMAGQYQAYTDYLLIMKHICLQLDSQLLWDPVAQTAWSHGGNSGSGTSGMMLGGGSKNGYTLWRVGLLVFAKRLESIQPDIYQHWLAEFLADWNIHHQNHHDDQPTQHDDAAVADKQQQQHHQSATTDRSILQAVWYMWHDLPNVLDETQLQNDLEAYWTDQQQQQQQRNPSASSSAAAPLLLSGGSNNTSNTTTNDKGGGGSATLTGARMGYVYEMFQRCHRYDPWLPVAWLQHIIDTQLYQPQAIILSDDICAALLSEGIESFVSSSSSSSSVVGGDIHANMIYQWWTLHTRYNAADAAARLQGFAKQAAANRSIADLLQFQHHFSIVLQMLPGAVAAVPTKAIYEAVVTEEVAETLAKYLDGILKSTKKLDLQPKDWLHKVIVGVFVPLSSKDVFEAFYKKDLAKRLLWNRVVSMDVEKQVCSMLKAECGSGYTSKIEGMFQDIENSRETMLVYQQQQPPALSTTTDATTFEVQVLTTGYWPLYPEYPNLILPQFLQDHQDHFVEFYKSKYQGRRVAWKYALGHCVIKTRGFGKPYELVLSLTQAIVLIQFGGGGNNNEGGAATTTRTLPELIKLTGLEDRDEMERILQSLSLGKDGTRILRKMDHPPAAPTTTGGSAASAPPAAAASKPKRIVSDTDTFGINESFSNKALRIRITNIMTKETKQERDTTVAAVCRDRLYLIDAAIVRILKSRKSLLHQALVPQVLEHLKFPAKIPDIKLRIESLIEREYVERDAQDRNRYNYLA